MFTALARKHAERRTITIVAIGSSSTAGSDLPDPKLAYPAHLEAWLNARHGAAQFKVINKGKGGEGIVETAARFADDVIALKPDLVIWQLGANDIVRNVDLTAAEASVEKGLAELAAAGVPVLMMDSQAAPRVQAGANREAVDRMLRVAARKHQLPYWSRYELMSAILASGAAKPVDLTKADDLHMTVAMHVCTAAALGDAMTPLFSNATLTAQRQP